MKHKIIICLWFLFMLNIHNIKAIEVWGSEMTYECLGQGNAPNTLMYKITVNRFQSCSTNWPHVNEHLFKDTIWLSPTDPFSAGVVFLDLLLDTTVIVPNSPFPCQIISDTICIKRLTFSGTCQFPISDVKYMVGTYTCCRTNEFANLLPNIFENGWGNYIEISPAAQEVCNNSPIFTEFPPTVICKDELLSMTLKAEDTDGDQLIYEFFNPLNSGAEVNEDSTGLIYNYTWPPPWDLLPFNFPEYHYTYPFGQSAYQSFNPATGDFEVIPNETGDFLVGFAVSDYRNGQLLNTVRSDFIVKVVDCQPKITAHLAADTLDAAGNYVFNLCNENTLALDNQSTYSQFIQNQLWTFNFNGNIETDTAWSPLLNFPDAGIFTGQLVLNPDSLCTDTANLLFNVTTEMQPDFQFNYDTCVGGPVSFFNESTTNGSAIQQYNWSLGDGEFSDFVNPIHQYAAPGMYDVQLRIENEYGCQDSLVRSFLWQPAPPIIIIAPSEQDGCFPLAVHFENLSMPVDSTYQVVWETGDGGILEGVSPNYSYADTGIYSIYVAITSPIGCFIDTVFSDLITVIPPPQANFSWSPEVVSNLQNEVTFENNSTGNLQNFWTINQQTEIFGEHPSYEFSEAGVYNIQLTIKNEYGCVDSLSKQLTVGKDYTYFLPNAFTPNEDGTNEVFKGKGILAGISNFEMSIWNRYGERVFLTNDFEEGWNGRRFNVGKLLTQGVYLCRVQFENEQGETVEFQEQVMLLR